MKKMTKVLVFLAMLCVTGGVWASDFAVDNLTVNSNATFYGKVNIFASATTNTTSSVPTNGLTLYYNFSAATLPVADQSGLGNNSTRHTATWTSAGKMNGGAYVFDGSDDRITSTSNPLPGLNWNSQFSLVMWLYKSSACGSDKMPLMINGVNGDKFGAGFYVNPSADPSKNICFGILKQNVAWSFVYSTALTADAWHFVVGTYSNRTICLYVNGSLQSSGTFPYTDTIATDQPLDLGAQAGAFGGAAANFFKGNIDEVKVFNRALSASEITALYTGGQTQTVTYTEGAVNVPVLTTSSGITQTGSAATNVFMGKVGIGTSNPAEKLHVVGNARIDGTAIANAITLGGVTRTDWPTMAVGALLAANNLNDVADKAAARSNLGVATAAQGAKADAALQPTGNGSQLTGITAAQVGAISATGGVVNGTLRILPQGDFTMGVFTNQ